MEGQRARLLQRNRGDRTNWAGKLHVLSSAFVASPYTSEGVGRLQRTNCPRGHRGRVQAPQRVQAPTFLRPLRFSNLYRPTSRFISA